MSRAAAPFRKADVQRAVSGAEAAGLKIVRVEVAPHTGCITLFTAEATSSKVDELGQWMTKHAEKL
jgi:hypothetical protein